MPPVRTQTEYDQQQHRNKLATSYQSLLTEFSSSDLKSVGNYTLGRLVGKGAFGKVYLATHNLTNGSKVVLKSTKKEDSNLAREIHHHRQFLHPHIARLYEVIVTESLVWLVLEYCPGDELYHHLLHNGRMEASKAQKTFTQLLGAVSYVHQKSCVHRDLKLENILLDKNGNVKLVDFGFTREYQGTTSYLQTWCGTVCYSAPEMLKGEKYAGEKVDVWSLGIILFALLCGELPFDEDDESATKVRILREEPLYPDHLPLQAKELIQKMLAKRPLIRPSLADLLKDPWLSDHAPVQQEILKLQQPAPFSTQLEKDTLERMRSAGVNIDHVIEHVLAQRCDSLAGWWALLIEKEQRKDKRREKKRKERESEAKSIRRLSAASGRLLSLGEIQESEEGAILESPRSRGRRATRANIVAAQSSELPLVEETKSPITDSQQQFPPRITSRKSSSLPRPTPPPKDPQITPTRRPRNMSRGSGSMLRNVTTNSELLSPKYVPPPQRKRRTFLQMPAREQITFLKTWFKEGGHKRGKSPNEGNKIDPSTNPQLVLNGSGGMDLNHLETLKRASTGPLPAVQHRRASIGTRPELHTRATLPARPSLVTQLSTDSRTSTQRKRTSMSPHTLTPHSSIRRSSAGLRGRKSTSSSVSSIRSAYQTHHSHNMSHSKASSTSSASLASPSGLSNTSASRVTRSPHSSVKVLPPTPTGGTLPSGVRISRRPPPSALGTLPPALTDSRSAFTALAPGSPGLPVFARRKRSVFKGPGGVGTSPTGFPRGGNRSTSVPRKSTDRIGGIAEEDEEEDEEDEMLEEDLKMETVDQFSPEFSLAADRHHHAEGFLATPPDGTTSPMSPAMYEGEEAVVHVNGSSGIPLTAQALARMNEAEREGVSP